MGSFISSLITPPPPSEESGSESNVIAVHSKDRFDEQFQAHKNANKAEVTSEWKVQAMPTFVIVKDGKEETRIVGANKDELQREIQKYCS